MKERPEYLYLEDIRVAANLAISFVKGLNRQAFERDLKGQGAVMYQIMIIGEATKKIPQNFRKAHPAIPWKEMAGMRDILIHNYNESDLDVVWSVVHDRLPELLTLLKPLIPKI